MKFKKGDLVRIKFFITKINSVRKNLIYIKISGVTLSYHKSEFYKIMKPNYLKV